MIMTELEKFQKVRERFKLVGILGSTYSGQSTVFDTILSRGHLGVQDHRGVYEDLVLGYLDGDPTCIAWYENSGTTPPRREGDDVIFDLAGDTNFFFSEEFLTNRENMHAVRVLSFTKKIERISASLLELSEAYPSITKDMEFPIFVDMPSCAEINYTDYVDHLILIRRPTEPDPNSWYMKYMCLDHDPNADNFIDLCVPPNIAPLLLASDDEAFSEIVLDMSKVTVIENFGTFEEYETKIYEVLEQFKDKLRHDLEDHINFLTREVYGNGN
jgi:hypothetical protein